MDLRLTKLLAQLSDQSLEGVAEYLLALLRMRHHRLDESPIGLSNRFHAW